MNDTEVVTFSKDSFLTALGLRNVEMRLGGPAERDFLFAAVEQALSVLGIEVANPESTASGYELPMRIPGTPIIVRLDKPTREEIAIYVSVAFYLASSGNLDAKSLAGTALSALVARVKRLDTKEGQRSVYGAVRDASPPTAENVTLALYGRPCPYPAAGCRFLATDRRNCRIGLDAVKATLSLLVDQKLLLRRNAVEPYEFGFTL